MSAILQILRTGWQRQPVLIALLAAGTVLAAALAISLAGAVAGALCLLAAALTALGRLQWGVLDGATLRVRDLRTGFVYRDLAARDFSRVHWCRTWLPHCRIEIDDRDGAPGLVLHAPSPDCATLRALTLWMIVHGRRRARIDPALLDALAAMPEHEPASLPRDAHHA